MFNRDFYPTPNNVIEQMLEGIDVNDKIILEPSAGKGNIVDFLKDRGAKKVLACEIEQPLQQILQSKCTLINSDFMNVTREDISHIDMIVMNPPFSDEEKHILHAWEIAPDGCIIISLCNYSLIEKYSYKNRKMVRDIVKENGRYEMFGDCFKDSERYTTVNIGCIWLQKPISESEDFSEYFSMEEEIETQQDGIMQYNDIYEVVSRFTGAVKMFDEVMKLNSAINEVAKPIGGGDITFGASRSTGNVTTAITKDEYRKSLQISSWKVVFARLGAEKYLTSKVKEQLNKAIERQTNLPFTMKNIYNFVRSLVLTHSSRMDDALVEAFDHICSLSAKNSTAGEKWKTNSHYKINERFIDERICGDWYWGANKDRYVSLDYRSVDKVNDIIKAICYLTGTNFEDTTPLSDFVKNMNMEWGKWYSWGFFEIRGYKKGTMHFKFQDPKVCEMFNRRVAEIKGWQLPQ